MEQGRGERYCMVKVAKMSFVLRNGTATIAILTSACVTGLKKLCAWTAPKFIRNAKPVLSM